MRSMHDKREAQRAAKLAELEALKNQTVGDADAGEEEVDRPEDDPAGAEAERAPGRGIRNGRTYALLRRPAGS